MNHRFAPNVALSVSDYYNDQLLKNVWTMHNPLTEKSTFKIIDIMISTTLWKKYNKVLTAIEKKSRTSNILGEYAEDLVAKVTNGQPARNSQEGYDVLAGNEKIQVKATRDHTLKTSTGYFHNLKFDKFIGIVFDKDGNLVKVIELSAEDARKIGHGRSSWSISWGRLVKEGHDITEKYKNVIL